MEGELDLEDWLLTNKLQAHYKQLKTLGFECVSQLGDCAAHDIRHISRVLGMDLTETAKFLVAVKNLPGSLIRTPKMVPIFKEERENLTKLCDLKLRAYEELEKVDVRCRELDECTEKCQRQILAEFENLSDLIEKRKKLLMNEVTLESGRKQAALKFQKGVIKRGIQQFEMAEAICSIVMEETEFSEVEKRRSKIMESVEKALQRSKMFDNLLSIPLVKFDAEKSQIEKALKEFGRIHEHAAQESRALVPVVVEANAVEARKTLDRVGEPEVKSPGLLSASSDPPDLAPAGHTGLTGVARIAGTPSNPHAEQYVKYLTRYDSNASGYNDVMLKQFGADNTTAFLQVEVEPHDSNSNKNKEGGGTSGNGDKWKHKSQAASARNTAAGARGGGDGGVFSPHDIGVSVSDFPCTSLLDKKSKLILNGYLGEFQQAKRLLFKASFHGFSAWSFHKYCDNMGPTVVLIKIHGGSQTTFGGYTPLNWGYLPSGEVMDDKLRSFLFTLKDDNGMPAKYHHRNSLKRAIYAHPRCGPVFGSGNDLGVYDDFSRSRSYSFNSIPGSYSAPSNTSLCGQYRGWKIVEMEVYSVS